MEGRHAYLSHALHTRPPPPNMKETLLKGNFEGGTWGVGSSVCV